ncbi:MAG: flavodoxin family protein [Chloroflexi bacterium]|nr:flavodoxin family protein [Chloroflexota bacterium]
MKLLALNGSPRPFGNTWTLLASALKAAQANGAQVEQVDLAKLKIAPCQACDSCRRTLRCRIADDMMLLYDKILDADVILIGTPVYFWSMSAQTKACVDRWYALDLDPLRTRMQGKRLGLISCYADATTETASGVVFAFRSAAEYLGWQFYEPVLVTAGAHGEAGRNPQALQAAAQLGRRLIE